MPLVGVSLLFLFPTYLAFKTPMLLKLVILGIIIINTLILPLLFSLVLKRKGIIESLHMESIYERRWPYLFSVFSFIVTIWMLRELSIHPMLVNFLMGATLAILLLLLVSFTNFKMSAHLVGMGGLAGMIAVVALNDFIDLSGLLIAIILLSGVLGTARLQLKAHRPVEVYSGFLAGFLVQLIYL